MNHKILVSLIIPVKNTPNIFLRRLAASIEKQTFRPLEVIFVDDNSDVKTNSELKKIVAGLKGSEIYAELFVHAGAGGVSSARNYGKQHANGEWICFVDSDDILSIHYVEELLKTAKKTGSLIAACRFRKVKDMTQVFEDGSESIVDHYKGSQVWNHETAGTGYVWNKLYHRSVIENLEFDETRAFSEDVLFVNQAFEMTPECAVTSKILYFYYINPQGASKTYQALQYMQGAEVGEYILNIPYVKDNNEVYGSRIRWVCACYLRYVEMLVHEGGTYLNEYKRIKKRIKDLEKYIEVHKFGNYEKLTYLTLIKLPNVIGAVVFQLVFRLRIIMKKYRRFRSVSQSKKK